jgi:uncharacterized protein YecA (UPF0149 family)
MNLGPDRSIPSIGHSSIYALDASGYIDALRETRAGADSVVGEKTVIVSILPKMEGGGRARKKEPKPKCQPVRSTGAGIQPRNSRCRCGSGKKYKHCCGGIRLR